MADKNLDELMKDLNTYTVQVAAEKKKAQENIYREPFIFPWKYLILAVGVSTWYFWQPIKKVSVKAAENPQVRELLKVLDQSEAPVVQGPNMVKIKQETLAGVEHSDAPTVGTGPDARNPAAAAVANNLVQIEGHWYKKTADNIYYINGRRVFFVDNRKRAEEKPQ